MHSPINQAQRSGSDAPAAPAAEFCAVCRSTSRNPFVRHDGHTVVECGGCGLRYLYPMPSTEAASALYSDDYFRNDSPLARGYDDYEAERDNMRATFRDRLRFLPKPARHERLLDVGAAAGFFVEQARLAGWDAEGIELNGWAAEYAREKLAVPVRHGSLEDAGYPDRSFAAVTLWEVIEHIPQPREFIREIARILQPGGVLALSTPDAGSAVARVFGRRWLGWKKIPEHVYFFDRETLGRLLREEGFEILSTRYVSLTVRAAYALERLAALVGVPWLARVPKIIGNAPIRVNPLYDLMLVARLRE
ncbi:MAG: class I SAM-dependent methyltransferase [Gemmatimonadaceae bacterium]|nr:class I SAM-dependent methyltransferase [Gemmatimonadaceae bacterium]